MTVLVTGSTGQVGSEVTRHLLAAGTEVRALTRSPGTVDLPDGARAVKGELTDVPAMRAALDGVSGLFLLSAVTLEELSASLLTLHLAREAGVRDLVYLSVIEADRFTDPPHFAAKAAVERSLAELGPAATVLRPGYYMQNDAWEGERLQQGLYTPSIGDGPVLMTDVRDLGEVAARAMLERQGAAEVLPPETIDVVEPTRRSGTTVADVWADVLGRPVRYTGHDLDAFEQAMGGAGMPPWMALDLRLMMARFVAHGMSARPGTDQRLQQLLGRPMRTYGDFAREIAAGWTR